MRRNLIALLVCLLPLSASARVLPSAGIRVAIDGRREAGIGLRPGATGWRLQLGKAAAQVTLVDLTGTNHDKWVLESNGGGVLLDGRFIGGHAYRVEVKQDGVIVDRGVIYLYPTRSGKLSRVAFDEVDAATSSVGAGDDDGIRIAPKSAL